MKSSRYLWYTFALVSLLATLLFLFGFIYAAKQILFPPTTVGQNDPAEQQTARKSLSGEQIRIVALGDSLTRGTGDQSGKGYVGHLRDLLDQELDSPVYVLNNFSVNGYRTDQLLDDLQNRSGVLEAVSKADIVLITIGGNDFFKPVVDDFNPSEMEAKMPEVLERLDRIFRALAEANGEGDIFYVGLYYPFADVPALKDGEELVHRWNYEVNKTAAKYGNITVVPTFDLFDGRLDLLLYSDHYHPNEEGYTRIARRILELLR